MKSTTTKVLVIDDDIDILQVVKLILTVHGFEVTTQSSARFFMQTVEEVEPDIVLLDVQLGDTDGRILCREMKQVEAYTQTKVILFTANPRYAENIDEYLCDGFIEKPFEIDHLVQTIRSFTVSKNIVS